MSRFTIPTREEAHPDAHPILDAVTKLLGFTPNLHRLMSLSPNVLIGWASLQGQLAKSLDAKTRDAIALVVSEADGCDYCLAAHSFIGANMAKMTPEEIAFNREGGSFDPKRAAAVSFAEALIEKRGKVSDADLAEVREAGYTDAELVAIVGLSAQFLLTNFMNNMAQTPIDFPVVEKARERKYAA
jgi:uncharacterized peroxidase-related enzyme